MITDEEIHGLDDEELRALMERLIDEFVRRGYRLQTILGEDGSAFSIATKERP